MKRFLAAALCATVILGAHAAEPFTRAQALQHLSDDDAAGRRDAVARLGEVGVMADAKLLVNALRDKEEAVRSGAEQSLWMIWARSGDKAVDAIYLRGVQQMSEGRGKAAIDTFSRIIKMKPDFAEAWNKRATVYFLLGEYEKSLADCAEVMKRNPYHFGALSGYFQIYMELDDYPNALRYGRKALQINPNMEGLKQSVEALERQLGQGGQVV